MHKKEGCIIEKWRYVVQRELVKALYSHTVWALALYMHAWNKSRHFLYIREAKLHSRGELYVVSLMDAWAPIVVFVEHMEIKMKRNV